MGPRPRHMTTSWRLSSFIVAIFSFISSVITKSLEYSPQGEWRLSQDPVRACDRLFLCSRSNYTWMPAVVDQSIVNQDNDIENHNIKLKKGFWTTYDRPTGERYDRSNPTIIGGSVPPKA